MKRSVSLFLLLPLLFNVLGYYGLFVSIDYRNDRNFINRLDENNYNHQETITLKIPLNVPYYADRGDFERVDGEFEHQGEFFRLVKQCLAKDTLYIVCIRDHESKKNHQALADYLKAIMDRSANEKPSADISFSMIKDYCPGTFCMEVKSLGWEHNIEWQQATTEIHSSFCASIIHPPERA